ncbi:zinc ribbon-containing protein [Enterovibrio makurazakiensis]|uniref:Zinc ribbon-containing protein n=1 Tax=Enterovibrio gelatinilyticus TaxID=2899819 RepID=A0ABT5QYE8_9GAMM|nr:zinc ribbon-containing protein [Enterovibrio sp. ZSDZ42]MDD1792640.1 zinc ribbon-containing protein [Enterovibrio sp. ZSDZ42]
MTEQKTEYKLLTQRITDALKHSPDELKRWLDLSERYFDAASDMTKDELALIEAYFKRDVQEFSEQYNESEDRADDGELFKSLIANTLWEQLAEITDKTQLEWHEVLKDIQHHGVYSAGEVVGLGILVCEKCGNQTEHSHVGVLIPCIKCGNTEYSRKPYPA